MTPAFPVAAPPQTPRLSRSLRYSISDLSPEINDQASKFIDGVVSLIWPYSNSTQQIAILVADPDFRIRRAKGQTKVTFHNDGAVAVAESHLGIGDIVHLSLEGAQYAQPRDDISIMGKRADWDLDYSGKTFMEVHRATTPLAVIDICQSPKSVESPLREIVVNGGYKTRVAGANPNQEIWPSPRFSETTSRLSQVLDIMTGDPFIEEDGYISGKGRKRARFSMDSASWRFLEEIPGSDDENRAPETLSPMMNPTDIKGTINFVLKSERAEDEHDMLAHSKQPDAFIKREDAFEDLGRDTDILMPPPPLTFGRTQPDEPAAATTTIEEEGIATADGGEHQQPDQVNTPPRASAPLLRPVASPGLPLISPRTKRHDADIGYLPQMSSTQSELDSSAESEINNVWKNLEPEAALPAAENDVFVEPSGELLSEDGKITSVSTFGNQTTNLFSPSRGDENLTSGDTDRDLDKQNHVIDQHPLRTDEPVSSSNEFEFLNLSPVELQSPDQRLPRNNYDSLDEIEREAPPRKVLMEISCVGTTSEKTVSPSIQQGQDHSTNFKDLSDGPRNDAHPGRLFEEPVICSDGNSVSQEQTDFTQTQNLPASSLTPQRSHHSTEALEVSAREVEGHGLSIKSSPIPFKQGWDAKAESQIKISQALGALHAPRSNTTRRKSYDGIEEKARSRSPESSDAESSLDSGRTSLFYNDDGNLIRKAIETQEEGSDVGGSYSEPDGSDSDVETTGVNTVSEEVIDNATLQLNEVETDVNNIAPWMEEDVAHTISTLITTADEKEMIISSAFGADDLTHEGFGHQSPHLVEQQEFLERLPEMPLSRSPSMAPPEGIPESLNMSSTPVVDLSNDSDMEEFMGMVKRDIQPAVTDYSFSRQPDPAAIQSGQLATPDNTQVETQHSRNRDVQEKHLEELTVQLPVSPQNTQDVEHKQATNDEEVRGDKAKEQTSVKDEEGKGDKVRQQASIKDSETLQLQPYFEVKNFKEETARQVFDEKHRRRSSRLLEKMPDSLKDPSKIISPYFTPRSSGRHDGSREVPTSPLQRPSSPETRGLDKIASLIPLNRNSSLRDLEGHPGSITSSRGTLSPPQQHPQGKGFTTPYSYYPSLSSIPTHFNDKIDILAVAVTASKPPQRAKSGPNDYYISLNMADSSCCSGDTISIQLFRPYKIALPTCARGNILLFRNMKVQTRRTTGPKGRAVNEDKELDGMMLLSTESSAWAVFKFPPSLPPDSEAKSPIPMRDGTGNGRPQSRDSATRFSSINKFSPAKMDVQICGPPVEFGAEERAFARGLSQWWMEEGALAFPDHREKRSSGPGRTVTRRAKAKGRDSLAELDIPHEILHEHELRDGMAYGDMISPRPLHETPHRLSLLGGSEAGRSQPEHRGGHEREWRGGRANGNTPNPGSGDGDLPDRRSEEGNERDKNVLELRGDEEEENEEEEEEEEEVTAQEAEISLHELRDGTAYGDTISLLPIHDHSDHNAADDHALISAVHNLRNGISYPVINTPSVAPAASGEEVVAPGGSALTTPGKGATRTRTRTRKRKGSVRSKSGILAVAHMGSDGGAAGNDGSNGAERDRDRDGDRVDEEDKDDEAVHSLRDGTRYTIA